MTKSLRVVALIAGSLLGSTLTSFAQTPAVGSGSGGAASVGSDVREIDRPSTNREPGLTTGTVSSGVVATDQPGVVPPSPTGVPVPNAAISKPTAVEAAPAGR